MSAETTPANPNVRIRLVVHTDTSDRIRTVELEAGASLHDEIGQNDSSRQIWVEGHEEPIAGSEVLAGSLPDDCHVFHGRCRRVIVGVRYNGNTISKEFRPTERVARILRWAINDPEFRITDPHPGDFNFRLSSAPLVPDDEDFVGSFAGDDCEVFLDLRPTEKFQGRA